MNNYICINGNKTELTTAQLRELGFATGALTISEISEIVRSGKARDHFKIHDVLTLAGYELEIIGFDHDRAYSTPALHTITLMSKTLLPARRMHSGACARGWIDTELRKWLHNTFLDQLPDELTPHICSVAKTTHNYKGGAFETVDSLFLPSESELFGSAIWAECEDGKRYEAFATRKDRQRFDEDGDADWYWTRSANSDNSTYFAIVSCSGNGSYGGAYNTTIRAPLCFCFA